MNVIQYCLTNGIYLREEAIPAAREAVRISPDSPEVLDLAGQVFFSQDDLVTAERYFLKAVSLQGNFYAAHLHLAYLFIKQGYFDLARSHLKTAIDQLESPDIREKAIQAYAKLPVE
jgi:tetratricopeptide (TPR) repeat protein